MIKLFLLLFVLISANYAEQDQFNRLLALGAPKQISKILECDCKGHKPKLWDEIYRCYEMYDDLYLVGDLIDIKAKHRGRPGECAKSMAFSMVENSKAHLMMTLYDKCLGDMNIMKECSIKH